MFSSVQFSYQLHYVLIVLYLPSVLAFSSVQFSSVQFKVQFRHTHLALQFTTADAKHPLSTASRSRTAAANEYRRGKACVLLHNFFGHAIIFDQVFFDNFGA